MIILDATTKSLEVKLGGAITTNQLTYVASYVDINNSTIAITGISEGDGLTNSGTAVTVVAAPGATTSRELKSLSVQNTDTVSQTVTVQYNNNGTKRPIIVQVLTAGQSLVYDEANGWTIAASSSGGSSLPDPVTVAHGGIGITVGVSGGIPAFTSTTTIGSSALLTANDLIKGGGAGVAPASWGTQTANTFLAGPTSGSAAIVTQRVLDPLDLASTVTNVTSQFDKTDTTLANVTGLSFTLIAGKTYNFRGLLICSVDATGGWKVGVGGTATATTVAVSLMALYNGSSPVRVNVTALGLILGVSSPPAPTVHLYVDGYIVVNAGGTLTLQFAQNTANGTSSVLVGSSLTVW